MDFKETSLQFVPTHIGRLAKKKWRVGGAVGQAVGVGEADCATERIDHDHHQIRSGEALGKLGREGFGKGDDVRLGIRRGQARQVEKVDLDDRIL